MCNVSNYLIRPHVLHFLNTFLVFVCSFLRGGTARFFSLKSWIKFVRQIYSSLNGLLSCRLLFIKIQDANIIKYISLDNHGKITPIILFVFIWRASK